MKILHKISLKNNALSIFSTRRCGNMSLTYGNIKDSLRNRDMLLNCFGVETKNLVCAEQIHENKIALVTADKKGMGALSFLDSIKGVDALITHEKNLPIAIFTADCLPVFISSKKNDVIGLVHAGWKGTKGGIVSNTIQFMREQFNLKVQDTFVSFGPAIRGCCYEVGEEFTKYFPENTTKRRETYFFDLISANKRQILESGIPEEQIFDSKICTYCENNDFFSYRREGPSCGRMMSVMMIK